MRTLFFEVKPKPDRYQEYLDIAAALKPELDLLGGCMFIDRFRSLGREGWILSHQLWRDEASLAAWRAHRSHHQAQAVGRQRVFDDYRLRIAEVLRAEEAGQPPWQAGQRSNYIDAARRRPQFLITAESNAPAFAAPSGLAVESFASINRDGEYIHLLPVPSWAEAVEAIEQCRRDAPAYRYRISEVDRDYGMFHRTAAPQYFPSAARDSSASG